MNKKIELGDIFEINTSKGKVYLHYICEVKNIGQLVRVLNGFFEKQPNSFDLIAATQEKFMIFFPIAAAYKRKIVSKVGNYPHDKFSKPKYMRSSHKVRGKMLGWHIIDTETWKMKLVEKLDSNQKKLSPWEAWNDTLLIERLENNWSLEKWL